MSGPKRIQRKRTKGWRMPEGVVYVGRPTVWGNPFSVGLAGGSVLPKGRKPTARDWRAAAAAEFRAALTHPASRSLRLHEAYPTDGEIREELAGRDLACWCPVDGPCHADVLLEIANA
jgi:hypothetical protein